MRLLLTSLLLLTACQGETEIAPPPSLPPGPSKSDTPASVSEQARYQLHNGNAIEGETFAWFDRTVWWDASPDRVFAVFNDAGPHLISSRDIADVTPIEATSASFQSVLRNAGTTIDRSPLDGPSLVLMGNEGYHREENGFGDYAWDLVKTDATGKRYTGEGFANTDYFVWEAPVYLPTAGTVVEVVSHGPDMAPGHSGSINNMVGVHLGDDYYLYLLHFRQDSIPENVHVGAQLEAGTYLGTVGNSGVTLEPHLHMTLLWRQYDDSGNFLRSWSLPSEFRNLFVSDVPNVGGRMKQIAVPKTGQWLSSSSF